MADNASGTGFGGVEVPFALDDIGGINYPRIKVGFGVDGAYTDVSSSNPLPVSAPINGFPIDVNGAIVEAGNPFPVTIASGSPVQILGTQIEDTPHTSGELGFPMFGVRQDTDAAAAANGDYTSFHTDAQGRLKVADRNDVVTTFTQAGVIAINTDLLVIDCQGFEAVSIHCTSMGTTGVVTPAWSNTNVTAEFINQSIMTPAGVAAATFNAAGMWGSVKQARFLRLRLTTATTAGTTTINVLGIAQGLNMPVQVQPVSGAVTISGTTPSFTRAINRLQRQDYTPKYAQLFDRAISLTTLNAVTTSLNTMGVNNAELVINIGTAGTPPQLQLEGSDDNANWYALGSPLTAVASSTVKVTVPDVSPAFIRARVSVVGVTVVAGYVLIKGF